MKILIGFLLALFISSHAYAGKTIDEERYFSDSFVCVKQVPYAEDDSNF